MPLSRVVVLCLAPFALACLSRASPSAAPPTELPQGPCSSLLPTAPVSCLPDGHFAPVQCDEDGSCWCSTQAGEEVFGTRRAANMGHPPCFMPCVRRLALFVSGDIHDAPECAPDGTFKPVQRSQDGTERWCVDATGAEIPNTHAIAGEPVECEGKELEGLWAQDGEDEAGEDDESEREWDGPGLDEYFSEEDDEDEGEGEGGVREQSMVEGEDEGEVEGEGEVEDEGEVEGEGEGEVAVEQQHPAKSLAHDHTHSRLVDVVGADAGSADSAVSPPDHPHFGATSPISPVVALGGCVVALAVVAALAVLGYRSFDDNLDANNEMQVPLFNGGDSQEPQHAFTRIP